MKKTLRTIAILSGIVCAVSAVILGWLYLEDLASNIVKVKNKITDKINERNALDEIEEIDFEPIIED